LCYCTTLGRVVRAKEKAFLESIPPDEIKRIRKEILGWTQQDVDIHLKLPQNHTNRVENGHILPKKELVEFLIKKRGDV
jgi:predicted transcriptional regulator